MSSLEFFWEQADLDGLDGHPLERELEHRLDALARYRDMIYEAEDSGHGNFVEHLIRQHEREERAIAEIRTALERMAQSAERALLVE
jgi:hypothetical protein